MCHVSVVMCHVSGFACHMSPATSHMQKVTATEPPPHSKEDRIRLDYEKIVFEEEKNHILESYYFFVLCLKYLKTLFK